MSDTEILDWLAWRSASIKTWPGKTGCVVHYYDYAKRKKIRGEGPTYIEALRDAVQKAQ